MLLLSDASQAKPKRERMIQNLADAVEGEVMLLLDLKVLSIHCWQPFADGDGFLDPTTRGPHRCSDVAREHDVL